MSNVGFYSVGKEMRKAQKTSWQCISRVISRVGQVVRCTWTFTGCPL